MERVLTPQQEQFLSYYTNPNSDTFSNALQSALKAKYSQEYAENITHLMPAWLSETMGDLDMLKKAERVLNKTLDYKVEDENGKVDSNLLGKQTDVAKFLAERLGKSKYNAKNDLNVVLTSKIISVDE